MRSTNRISLAEFLAEHYEIGELCGAQRLDRGYVNVSYVIETEFEGRKELYFFRRYKESIQEEEVRFEHSLIQHLVRKRFGLVADIIPTKEGKSYVKGRERTSGDDGEVFYAVFEHLSGEDRYTWDNPGCNKRELASAAEVLARFHHAASDLDPQGRRYEPKIRNLLPEILDQVVMTSERVGETVFDRVLSRHTPAIIHSLRAAIQAFEEWELDQLPLQPIHCDFHPGNLKFEGESVTGLYDFDWSKMDARSFDLGLALTYFCTPWDGPEDGQFDLRKAAAFLTSYQRTLRQLPKANLLGGLESRSLPLMIRSSNFYLLHWTIVDFYATNGDAEEYERYLRHLLNLLAWLGDPTHRSQLEGAIAGSI
jgi:homoserine kinase type II